MKEVFFYGYFVILVILSIYGFHRYYMIYLYRKYKDKNPVPESQFKELPPITIQLPVFNEKYVVERLIEKVAMMRYPRNLLQIQVLDDSTDDTSTIAKKKCDEIRARGIDIAFIHRTDRSGFKAGALENGLKTATGEFVAVFDADFLPDEDFLEKTIHYFTDSKIGMVQARWDHENRRYSLLTECQSILLDGHFMIEHTARNRSGRFFNFNGTAGMWRKSTIADAGGWQHDTLTEDLDLSYRAQLKGWKFIFLPNVTVPAELPIEMSAFKAQQFRWAKGSIQTFMKIFLRIVKSDIPLKNKVESFFHMGANFAYLLMVMLSLLMPINIVIRYNHGFDRRLFILDLPIFIFATLSVMFFYFYSEYMVISETLSVRNRSKAKPLIYLPFVLSIGIGLCINNCKAVIEALIKKNTPFNRTPKYNVSDKGTISTREKFTKLVANVYRIKKVDWVSIIELCMGVYFTFAVYYAFDKELYFSLPFIMLFQIGFLYTAFLSMFNSPLAYIIKRK